MPAFPDVALDVDVELWLGQTLGWVDITGHVYTRDPITIVGGRADEGSSTDPTKATLTINNRDGRYSARNPLSPYYGVLGRNTPLRVSLPYGSSYLRVQQRETGSNATCPDSAALGVTGDLDVRIDVDADQWQVGELDLAAKYLVAGDQGSWFFGTAQGAPLLFWTPDGTFGSARRADATEPLPVARGRLAVRATLDVDNGAGGHTVTFYTADTIDGPWTQLGDAVTAAGTTSVFDSTAPIEVGDSASSADGAIPGRYLAFELYDGIGGTLVADPDFSAQTAGDTSFADAQGNTWTVNAPAEIDDRDYRFHGEVSSWPMRWHPSGADVWEAIEAAGILRRLGQGTSPLDSALYRDIAALDVPYVQWWPLESGGGELTPSGIMGRASMRVLGKVEFGADGAPPGASGAATFEGMLHGAERPVGKLFTSADTVSGEWIAACWMDIPPIGDLATGQSSPWLCIQVPGSTIRQWALRVERDTATQHKVIVGRINSAGVGIDSSLGRDVGGTHYFVLHSHQDGPDWIVDVYLDGEGLFVITVPGETAQPVRALSINHTFAGAPSTEVKGAVSHLLVAGGHRLGDVLGHYDAGTGYTGETAGRRFQRLCGEESVPFVSIGDLDDTEAMGPQTPMTLLDLLTDCAGVDMGAMYEPRDALALGYRTRTSTYNQPPALTLDYATSLAAPLEPVDDDQHIRNDVAVERPDGSSVHAVLETGPLSVQAPPDGVGRYDDSIKVNVARDDQLADQAGWRLHMGTVDEARYPVVRVKLHKHPDLIPSAAGLAMRSLVRITGLPAWLPPDDVDVLTEGYTEVIEPLRWSMEFNCAPGSPWRTAVLGDDVLGRADTDGAHLAAAADATTTTLSVATGIFEDFEDATLTVTITGTWARTTTDAHSGSWSLRSAAIGNSATSDAVLTVPPGAGRLTFWWRVSSEAGFDFFHVLMDDATVLSASGESGWRHADLDVTAAEAVTLRYAKDDFVAGGSDAAWVDEVWFDPAPLWTVDPAEFPFDIRAGGEVMTVTGITGASSPQAFTVTRSINGVVKAHGAGTDVRLRHPMILSM